MGPLPQGFAADAYDCIMVSILTDRPNTRMRAIFAPDKRAPLGIVVVCSHYASPDQRQPATVLVTVKGKLLRDGLRPHLDRHCARRPAKARLGRGDKTIEDQRPFEFGSQVLISSHRKLLSSKATVVNVAEKSGHDLDRRERGLVRQV